MYRPKSTPTSLSQKHRGILPSRDGFRNGFCDQMSFWRSRRSDLNCWVKQFQSTTQRYSSTMLPVITIAQTRLHSPNFHSKQYNSNSSKFFSLQRATQKKMEGSLDSYRDTTSGERLSYWFQTGSVPKYQPLKEDISADVCVVGGGIGGLTTAYMLQKEGLNVVLIEDGELASGETGRTTAHLFNGMDDRFYNIESHHGVGGLQAAAESHTAAINMIESIVKTENIDCEFERLDGYLFLGQGQSMDILNKEMDSIHRSGLQVEWVDNVPQPTFKTGKCIRFPGQGMFQPLKYCAGLANAITRMGGKIFTRTHASEFKTQHDPITVTTSGGRTVTSKYLVMATLVPVNDRFVMYTKMEPDRSYAIAVKIPKGSVAKALYWDTEDPYHYVRLADGPEPGSEVLITGGEDHPSGNKYDTVEERYQSLYKWTKERFPMAGEIVAKWSGHIIEPVDDVGFLGRNPSDSQNVFIITGDSGQGMTHTTIGAMIIKDLVLKHNKLQTWEKLYDPSRLMTDEIREFVKTNVHVQVQYTDWLTPGELKDIEDLKPGSGCIIREGLKKTAVYRDGNGKFHACSAVCPHLGAIVHWNDSEKSWDCPAHGSRFDKFGKVVTGPANTNLAPTKLQS